MTPTNSKKEELRYFPRSTGRSYMQWQHFIALSRAGESVGYLTPEGLISSPAHTKKLIVQALKELKEEAIRADSNGIQVAAGRRYIPVVPIRAIDNKIKELERL